MTSKSANADWVRPAIACLGRCDPFGDLDPKGKHVRLVYNERHSFNGHETAAVHGIALTMDHAKALCSQLLKVLANA